MTSTKKTRSMTSRRKKAKSVQQKNVIHRQQWCLNDGKCTATYKTHASYGFEKFVLLDWIKRDLIIMKRVNTSINSADSMTKQTGKQLFYRHFDYILGKVKPSYVKAETQVSTLGSSRTA